MKSILVWAVTVCALLAFTAPSQGAARHRLGAGVHYWTALEDIDADNVDENGFAYVFSYQYKPAWLVKFGAELEVLPDSYGGADEQVYAPQAYVFVGGLIYAGIGIGGYYSDGEFGSDPFYNLRAGVDLTVLPRIHVDINANYRFNEWDDIKAVEDDISVDTVTLGAAIRLAL